MPKIHQFGLTDRQIRALRACYDLDVLHSSDESSSSAEEEMPQELHKRLRPQHRLPPSGSSSENRPDPTLENRPDQTLENRAGPSIVQQASPTESIPHSSSENRLGSSSENRLLEPSTVINPIFSKDQLSKSNRKSAENVSFDDGARMASSVVNSDQPGHKTGAQSVKDSSQSVAKPVAGSSITYKKAFVGVPQPKRWLGKAKSNKTSGRGPGIIEVLTFDSQETTKEDTEVTEKSENFQTAEDIVK